MLVCMRVRVVPVGAERAEVVAVVEHTTTVPCSGRAWRTLPAHARQALLAFTSLRGPRRNGGEGGDALVYYEHSLQGTPYTPPTALSFFSFSRSLCRRLHAAWAARLAGVFRRPPLPFRARLAFPSRVRCLERRLEAARAASS